MSLRDDIYMSTAQLMENMDRCNDASLERCHNEASEYLRLCRYLTQCFENSMKDNVASMYMKGNVLRHKMTGSKHVVTEDEYIDDNDIYEFICEAPHLDGDYSYTCGKSYCRCVS